MRENPSHKEDFINTWYAVCITCNEHLGGNLNQIQADNLRNTHKRDVAPARHNVQVRNSHNPRKPGFVS